VSLGTTPKPDSELAGLVRSLTRRPSRAGVALWKRPEALAVAILLAAIALSIFFA